MRPSRLPNRGSARQPVVLWLSTPRPLAPGTQTVVHGVMSDAPESVQAAWIDDDAFHVEHDLGHGGGDVT
jgi:hypothetical protein